MSALRDLAGPEGVAYLELGDADPVLLLRRAIIGGTATAGDEGTATAGDRGTATAGDRGTVG